MTTNENVTETPLTLSQYLAAGTAHAACDHPMTKAGRAQCRRDKVRATSKLIAVAAIVFVRRARAKGHVNLLHRITLDEVASERGISPKEWSPAIAVREVKESARLMDETHLLGDDMK
ncbi:hypothetical protein SEA_ZUKO_88 [Streptomyces phage Zuko]|uniref:Uncharacterized protein n=1 Tax=Streptomyces phage Zuko TaxID=2601695 RepID=A0A5J6D7X2_9CAUD|nr:hypothetical protein PP630_gp088 [Streptomyces phage Zuko]QEQ93666.1 hypothetical protein SEA_ZUKO_88 [Streptomyces phage Zuko]